MIYYHAITGMNKCDQVKLVRGRHCLVSYAYREDMGVVGEMASSFILDNGAFTYWGRGEKIDMDRHFQAYLGWVLEWYQHPGFDWAVIPDVIGGNWRTNRLWAMAWYKDVPGVPVWHLNDPLEYLEELIHSPRFNRVCLATAGYADPKSAQWLKRMGEAMEIACDASGRPRKRLHGLGIMAPERLKLLPFASADSSNVVQNRNTKARFGCYPPATEGQRAVALADSIECYPEVATYWDPAQADPDHTQYMLFSA